MRILFLTTAAEDFHQDLVFHGLVTLLGRENVWDVPEQPRYAARPPPDYRHQAMAYLDLPPGGHGGQALEDLAGEADAVVVGAVRGDANLGLLRLLELGISCPVAVLDGADDPYVRAAIDYADVYFKRETLPGSRWLQMRLPIRKRYHALRGHAHWNHPLRRQIALATPSVQKLVPLPLGIIDAGTPLMSREKLFDVTFIGARTSPQRALVVSKLRALRAEGYRVKFPDDPAWSREEWYEPTRIPWAEYMRLSSESRICLNVRGLGYDTFRYWEIPYSGSLLLSEPPRTVIPNNFVDGAEAVFGPASKLDRIAKRLLEGDTEEIAAAGREKLLEFHTSTARAQVVLDHLEALVPARSG